MENVLFIVIITLVIFSLIFELFLNYLTKKSLNYPIPSFLSDIYDNEQLIKFKNYKKEHIKLDNLQVLVSSLIILLILSFKLFGKLDTLIKNFIENQYLITITYFFILFIVAKIINLPFSIYSIFKIEKKYGFSNYTPKLFVQDMIKNILLSIIFGIPLLLIVLFIYFSLNKFFVPLVFLVLLLFNVFISYFYTTLILPLFNKIKPIEDENLRKEIEEICNKTGFKIKSINYIDESKRTTKGNAFFSGFGKNKKIIFYDTLLKDFSTKEIISILLHEIGHYKFKHILKLIAINSFHTFLILFVLWFILDNETIAKVLGANSPSFHINLLAFGIIYSPITYIISPFLNFLSRKFETQADNFVKKYNYQNELIIALKKLTRKNFINLTPHPLVVKLTYTHPPLSERIKNLSQS